MTRQSYRKHCFHFPVNFVTAELRLEMEEPILVVARAGGCVAPPGDIGRCVGVQKEARRRWADGMARMVLECARKVICA